MYRATLAVGLFLLVAGGAGCSKKTANGSDGCGGNDACTAGQVCNNDVCQTLCAADKECLGDEICTDQLCVKGSRPQPTLTFVDGDGDGVCPDGSTGRHCLHAGLMVQGTNLLGSAFSLTPTSPAAATLALTVRSGATDVQAELDLPDVVPGNYTLTATNNSGSADQALTLLQGETGPKGDAGTNGADGSPDTAAEVLAKIITVDGPSSTLDADTLDGQHAAAFANADTLDTFHAAQIVDQATDFRCFTVTNDNTGGASPSKLFNFPYDCLGPMGGGQGCWGQFVTLQGTPVGSTVYTADLQIFFTNSSGWYVSASRPDGTVTRLISTNNGALVNPTGDGGACQINTTTAGTKATLGFNNFTLTASSGRYCYVRLCEPRLAPTSAQ